MDPWSIIYHPLLTEKAIGMVEKENKLMFIVSRKANKKQIRWAIETALEVKVDSINTLIDKRGKKRAIVKLSKEFNAADIATRFGML
ncbi:MAG: 50S ribosomal protein L23 [Candidatus Aenigmatarchaeota archaeon]